MIQNAFRKIHGSPPLKMDLKMAKSAEEWAKTLVSKGLLERNLNAVDGENLFYECGSNIHPVKDAIISW